MRQARFLLALPLALTACGLFEHEDGRVTARVDIPVVDEGGLSGRPKPCQDPGTPAPADPTKPFGSDADRARVRGWIQRLMDETRIVPDTAAKKGGPRGSPGSFAKLSDSQVEEFCSAVIYAGNRFSPQSLPDDQKQVLVAAEISIESAFTPSTSGVNPGDNSKVSVGPLQLTLPGMWDDIFRQYAHLPGLVHADGSPWDPAQTTREQFTNSIFDGIISGYWCITEQARRGVPDWFGSGQDGPCPKNMHSAYLAWVIGGPALKSGGDLGSADGSGGQRDAYLASISTDLAMLGYSASLINAQF